MGGEKDPTVSVIVPAYNAAAWVEECLESVAAQTYADFECIVVDDGSTDGSADAIDRFAERDPRFKAIHQANGGLSAARNEGIRHARGTYLTFVDSDDSIEPRMIESLVRAAEKHAARVVLCDYAEVTQGAVVSRGIFDSLAGETIDERAFWRGCYGAYKGSFIFVWGKLFQREVFEAARFPEGYIYEDQITALDLYAGSGPFAVVREPLYRYRVHGSGLTHQPDPESFFMACEAFLRRDRYLAEKGWGDVRMGNLRKLISYLLIIHRLPALSQTPSYRSTYEDLRIRAKRLCWKMMPRVLLSPASATRVIPFMVDERLHERLFDAWHRVRGI